MHARTYTLGVAQQEDESQQHNGEQEMLSYFEVYLRTYGVTIINVMKMVVRYDIRIKLSEINSK